MMTTIQSPFLRHAASAALVVTLALPGLASAQEPRLPLERLDGLADKAVETVTVDLDEKMLHMAAGFLKSNGNKDEATAKEVISGIKGIYVRSFEFEKPGEYPVADVEAIRTRLRSSGWAPMVQVRSKRNGENADVFMAIDGTRITGIAIVVSGPKQVTVVNIVGVIDPDKLSRLSGNFGIPELEVGPHTKRDGASKP